MVRPCGRIPDVIDAHAARRPAGLANDVPLIAVRAAYDAADDDRAPGDRGDVHETALNRTRELCRSLAIELPVVVATVGWAAANADCIRLAAFAKLVAFERSTCALNV